MLKKTFCILLVIASLATEVSAKWIEDALREPIGVRAAGMGGAFTAVADDSSALFYNPAGLAEPGSQYQSGMMDNSQAKKNLSAYSVLNYGPLAYGERRVVSDENELANIYSYAFAQRGNNGINWGLAYKHIVEDSYDRNSDEGYAFDLGLLFKMTPEVNIGVLAQNISAANIDLVPNYRLGGSCRAWDTLWSVDGEYRDISPYRDTETVMHYGLEKELIKGLALRIGSDANIGTLGFSVGLPFVIFEYATWDTDPQTFRFGFKIGQDKYQADKDRTFALFKEKDFVEMEIDGNLIAGQDSNSFLGGAKQGADVLQEQVRLARKDKQVGGLILKIGGLDSSLGSFGTIQELREELQIFRKSGKKIIAYLEADGDYASYYLASVADKIIMPQGGTVGLFGVVLTPMYFGKLFDNIGVRWKTIYAGKYKTGTHPENESLPTASREVLMAYINNVNEQIISDLKTARKLPESTVGEIRTGKLFIAKRAKELGLIDDIGHYDRVKEMVKDVAQAQSEPGIIKADALKDVRDAMDLSYLWPWPHKVAVIDIDGVIILGKGNNDMLFGSKSAAADDICEELEKAANDPLVKVIILRINSPGGAAIAADQIYEKILEIKEKHDKIVIASCGNVAASGGYYIATAADRIIANRATIVGSIGVYQSFPIYYGLLQKIDVRTETLKTGESVDMLDGLRDLSPTETALLQDSVDAIHEQFIMVVARGRKLEMSQTRKLSEGQIFTGAQAKANGLVDDLGNFTKALAIARELGGLKGEIEIVRYVRNDDIWQQIGFRVGTFLSLDKQISLYLRPSLTQYRLII
jgi:protease-4